MPLADALGVGGALAGVGVGELAEPLGRAVTLAGLPAIGLRAQGPPAAMTRIGMEEPVAMEALGGGGDAGPRREEDALATGKGRPEAGDAGAGKKTGRRKKGRHLGRKKTPPRPRRHTGISDRQNPPN